MKLINNSTRTYIAFDFILEAGKVLDIKDKIAIDILLKQPGIEEYIDKEEVEKIKEENKKLKEEAKKEAKKETKKSK